MAALCSPPVIRLEIIPDRLGVHRIDRRAKRLDHFGDFRVPLRRAEKRRVHHDIVEAVAAAAGTKANMAKIAIPRMAFSLHNIERHGLNDVVVKARRVLDRLIGLRLADPVGGAGCE
jgi:hypothetical protein